MDQGRCSVEKTAVAELAGGAVRAVLLVVACAQP